MAQRRSTEDESRPEQVRQSRIDAGDRLMLPKEVAAMFRVNPRTVTRWARDGWLPREKTLGGQTRLWESDVRALLQHRLKESSDPDLMP